MKEISISRGWRWITRNDNTKAKSLYDRVSENYLGYMRIKMKNFPRLNFYFFLNKVVGNPKFVLWVGLNLTVKF